ncbi:MAG: CRISPR-associated protein Cas5 [Exilispira sp.]
MQALRIRLYQNLCNYRREGSFGYVQTYPLPTPSMVRGMVHDILEATEYKKLKISIQGESETIITNVQKVYKFDRDPRSRPQNPYIVTVGSSTKTVTHGISYVDLHVNMRLLLHIMFYEDNDNNIRKLFEKIQQKTLVLGRNEDIALIEDIKIVELTNFQGRGSPQTKFSMYVLPNALVVPAGTLYKLPFWYDNVNSFNDNRVFHFVDAFYVDKGVALRRESVFIDNENGDLICFLESPK